MTPCEKLGYNVNDEFVVTENLHGFKCGQVVTLFRDDGSAAPLFKGDNEMFSHCNGEGGAFVHFDHVKPLRQSESLINQLAKAVKKRDKQAEKVRKHQERLAERESTVTQLRIKLENEIEDATGLQCRIGGEEPYCEMTGVSKVGTIQVVGREKTNPFKGTVTWPIPEGVDVDDPKTWKKGDVIECVDAIDDFITDGNQYVFSGLDGGDDVKVAVDDDGDEDQGAYSKFRFVRRPS